MKQVLLAILEDTGIKSNFRSALASIPEKSGYEFKWHSSWVEEISLSNYTKFLSWLSGQWVDDTWGKLEGYAVIYCDLVLGDLLDDAQEQELRRTLGEDIVYLEDELAGLYAIATALQNRDWRGVLVIASSKGDRDEYASACKKLESSIAQEGVVVVDAGRSMSGRIFAAIEDVVKLGIDEFIKRFGPLEYRLWPDYTESWYTSGHPEIPHNYRDIANLERCKNAVRKYLSDLFMLDLPSDFTWFQDNDQFEVLFHELSYLVGSKSTAQAGLGRNLTLGGVVLVLAAATTVHSKHWVEKFHWQYPPRPILPEQGKEQARTTILTLAKDLFPHIGVDDYEGHPIVHRVKLLENKLKIYLNLSSDKQHPKKGEKTPTLLTKVLDLKETNGKVYTGYRRFLVESAKAKHGGREARCVMNLIPEEEKIVLEIVPCL